MNSEISNISVESLNWCIPISISNYFLMIEESEAPMLFFDSFERKIQEELLKENFVVCSDVTSENFFKTLQKDKELRNFWKLKRRHIIECFKVLSSLRIQSINLFKQTYIEQFSNRKKIKVSFKNSSLSFLMILDLAFKFILAVSTDKVLYISGFDMHCHPIVCRGFASLLEAEEPKLKMILRISQKDLEQNRFGISSEQFKKIPTFTIRRDASNTPWIDWISATLKA